MRQRLRIAFKALRRLQSADLPDDMRADWQWILRQMTRLGPDIDSDGEVWKSAAENTMDGIRNSTGSKIAQRIHELYIEIVRRYS